MLNGLAKRKQRCATWWPNARNMLFATMLHDVAPFDQGFMPWSNGTPNSTSQLEPSYKIKTCFGGWPRYRQVEPACKKPFNCLNTTTYSHIKITEQLGESWLELAEVAKRWKTWLELGANLSLVKFKPTQAKWVAKPYPTPSTLWTWLELAWVGRAVWPGL